MEPGGWTNPMTSDDKQAEGGAVGAEYAGGDAGNNVEAGTDANYMYDSQAGHNGAAPGDGY
jgi:hypothetical protein